MSELNYETLELVDHDGNVVRYLLEIKYDAGFERYDGPIEDSSYGEGDLTELHYYVKAFDQSCEYRIWDSVSKCFDYYSIDLDEQIEEEA